MSAFATRQLYIFIMQKIYTDAKFLLSCPSLAGCPEDMGFEVMFVGRSNAGKSSAINTITSQKIAKVSRTPGRTQHLVFFELDENRRLVDLPGYGYAKAPKSVIQKWHHNMDRYFSKRQCLKAAILVMDCRRPLQPFDQTMLNWCIENQIYAHILLTKSDKLKKNAANNTYLKTKNLLKNHPTVSIQLFSSLKKQGLTEAWQKLDEFFQL